MLFLAWPALGAELPSLQGWIEVRTENFVLYSNASPGKTKKLAIDLERFREVLGLITKGFDLEASVPTSVYVFKNEAGLLPYKLDASGNPRNLAGYFLRGRFRNYIALDVSAAAERSRIVYHEYVHSMLHETFGSMPQWLDEGLAEYYSTFRFNNLSSTAWVGDSIDGHLYLLSSRPLMNLDRLFTITTRSPEYNEETMQGLFYAQSWLLVHYLVATDELRSQFGKFLTGLREGADAEQAIQDSLQTDLATLAQRLEQYLAKGGSGNYRINLADDVKRVDPTAVPMLEAMVLLRLGELLANRGSGHEGPARAHVEKAIEQEAPPGQAYATLGVIAEGIDDDEAEEWYRKSLSHVPDDSVVLTRLAGLVLHKDTTTSDASQDSGLPSRVLESRALFQRALELDGTNVEAMVGMGRTYFWEEKDFDPGLKLLASAATLRPDRVDIVVDLVNLLAWSGRRQAAWVVLDQKLRGTGTDPEILADAEERIAVAEMEAASERMRVEDTSGAMAIVQSAMQRVQDPTVRKRLIRFREEMTSGDSPSSPVAGSRVSTGATAFAIDDLEEAKRLLDRHNEAANLLNAGQAEQALSILDEELEDCAQPQICESLRSLHEQIVRWIGKSRGIDRYNEAVGLLDRGKRKAAIEILHELDDESMDEEVRQRARELMSQIGVRQRDGD